MEDSNNPAKEKVVINREAWPASGIHGYSTIDSGDWGYLVIYSDCTTEFIEERPSKEEIYARWGYALHDQGQP